MSDHAQEWAAAKRDVIALSLFLWWLTCAVAIVVASVYLIEWALPERAGDVAQVTIFVVFQGALLWRAVVYALRRRLTP